MSEPAPLKKILKSKIESDMKNQYSMEITNNTKLNILIKSQNKVPNLIYEENFSLDQIKNMCKYFLICETIDEVIYSLEQFISKTKLIEDINKIKLIVELNHPLCKEGIFIINKKKKDVFESINDLYNIIYDLKTTVQNQQNIINSQNEEINKLKEKIEKLENKEKLIKPLDNNFMDSNIISNNIQEVVRQIKKWINPNRNIEFKLIFRKSRDGSTSSDFHKHCDSQGATLCLIQTSKNYIFGGYTTIPWQNRPNLKCDDSVFIFSLDLMKKYTKFKGDNSVFSYSNYGPCFGENGADLYLKKDLNSGNIKSGNILKNCELTNGEEGDFQVKEFEVFKVNIN